MTRKIDRQVDWTGQKHLAIGEKVQRVEPERSVLKRVTQLLWSYGGVEVMRNSVGRYRKGKHWITYGLGVGSSDLVAIVAPYGRWLCLELKRPKNAKETDAQAKWLEKMRRYGAVAAVVRSPEEVPALVELARKATR